MRKILRSSLNFVSIIYINFIFFLLLLFFLTFIILLEARFSDRSSYYFQEGNYFSYNDCMKSDHIKVSKYQAKILKKSSQELEIYCKSTVKLRDQSKIQEFNYWDYHAYSHSSLKSQSINYNEKNLFNSRFVPCSDNKNLNPKMVVWVFGGSTLQNSETSDKNTIANHICKGISKNNKIRLLNLGVGSFYSEMEIIKFINLYKLTLKNPKLLPNIAIFYTGINDSKRVIETGRWAGLPQDITEKYATTLSNRGSFYKSIFYGLEGIHVNMLKIAKGKQNIISDFSFKFNNFLRTKIFFQNDKILEKIKGDYLVNNKLLSSISFLYDQKTLSGICKSLKVRCLTILQPSLVLRTNPVGEVEKLFKKRIVNNGFADQVHRFFREVKLDIYKLENEYFRIMDMTKFSDHDQFVKLPLYYDMAHTGFFTSEFIGKEISFFLEKNNMIK